MDLFLGLVGDFHNRGWAPTAAALPFGREATLARSVVDKQIGFQLVAGSTEGLEVIPTVPPTRGLRDNVVDFKLANAPAAKPESTVRVWWVGVGLMQESASDLGQ